MMRLILLITGLLMAACSARAADIASTYGAPVGSTRLQGVVILCPSVDGSYTALGCATGYQLLGINGGAGSTVTGASVKVLGNATYQFYVSGTFNGASVQLQALGPDGVTYVSVGSAITAVGYVNVVLGAGAVVRALVTGSGYTLWASLT